MVRVIFTAKLLMGFLNVFELDIVLFVTVLFIAVNESKMLAIDSVISGNKDQYHSKVA